MSRTFTTTSTLSTAPATTASTRRGRGREQRRDRDDDEQLERDPHELAEREAARLVGRDERDPDQQQREHRERHGVPSRALRVVASPAAPQPPVHWPTEAASATSAAPSRTCVSVCGRMSAAASVSTTPCTAATTLRQRRGGSDARIHGSSHSPARKT